MDGRGVEAAGEFEPVPSSAGAARRLVRNFLVAAGRRDLLDSAELVVSELVTNAILHTATPVSVTATLDSNGLLVEVSDGSRTMPAERDHAALAGTGRGLALVHELGDGWGVRLVPEGKVVWARVTSSRPPEDGALSLVGDLSVDLAELASDLGVELAAEMVGVDFLGPSVPEASPRSWSSDLLVDADVPDAPLARPGEAVFVVLRNVPLLMHLAWHEHAETILREYLLARLESDETTALAEHAVASAAMALLHDQVPAPELPGGARTIGDVTDLLTAVVEPAASLDEGRLRVPADAVAGFETLSTLMDAAVALAEADELLAAPMQPELRELRRWLCHQVTSQSVGVAPIAWAPPSQLPPPGVGVRATDWDRRPVDRATRALVAADDTNRIIAVSRPALDLLGYEEAGQLVGHRLLELIPRRFHQGHLAGFTLHLTQGRAALIGTPAIVPFVRADGSETDLELLVEALTVADGRRVFVATMREP